MLVKPRPDWWEVDHAGTQELIIWAEGQKQSPWRQGQVDLFEESKVDSFRSQQAGSDAQVERARPYVGPDDGTEFEFYLLEWNGKTRQAFKQKIPWSDLSFKHSISY